MTNLTLLLLAAAALVTFGAGPIAYVLYGVAAFVELVARPVALAAIQKAREDGVQI